MERGRRTTTTICPDILLAHPHVHLISCQGPDQRRGQDPRKLSLARGNRTRRFCSVRCPIAQNSHRTGARLQRKTRPDPKLTTVTTVITSTRKSKLVQRKEASMDDPPTDTSHAPYAQSLPLQGAASFFYFRHHIASTAQQFLITSWAARN